MHVRTRALAHKKRAKVQNNFQIYKFLHQKALKIFNFSRKRDKMLFITVQKKAQP